MLPPDDRAAMYWHRRSAAAGEPGEWSMVARMYEKGMGVPRDPKKAFEIVLADACRGDIVAIWFLGRYYRDGVGVTRDRPHGVALLEEAVRRGFEHAAYEVARSYRLGLGVQRSAATAAYWLCLAAFADVPLAAYDLALMFEDGRAMRRSPRDAFYFMTLAAEFLDEDAFHSLGWYHQHAFGCRRDDRKAVSWYEDALVWRRNAASARNVARIYARGSRQVPRDLDAARGYLELALSIDTEGTLRQLRSSPELRGLLDE